MKKILLATAAAFLATVCFAANGPIVLAFSHLTVAAYSPLLLL